MTLQAGHWREDEDYTWVTTLNRFIGMTEKKSKDKHNTAGGEKGQDCSHHRDIYFSIYKNLCSAK